jgi:ABC-type sugar transport system substrate-binding protein
VFVISEINRETLEQPTRVRPLLDELEALEAVEAGGRAAAVAVADCIKERTGKAAGKVAYLTAMAGHESLDSRDKGFIEGMKAFPEIKVIGNHVANNEEAEGMNRQFAVPRPLC